VRTTGSDHDGPIFPNPDRNIMPSSPDSVWVADITHIRNEAGFCDRAAALDACGRKVVDCAISKQIDTPLALAALKAAVEHRKPPRGCIHHSDRGCQSASAGDRKALKEYSLEGSMCAPASPHHNAQAESIMKTLHVEEVCLTGYETFADMAASLPRFIDEIHGVERIHSAIAYPSPDGFEARLARQAAWIR
jgi:putative transposase